MTSPDWHPLLLTFEVVKRPRKAAGEYELAITSVQRDDYAIRVNYEVRPPLPEQHFFGPRGEATDDRGNEYEDAGGAFGPREDPPRTEGVLSFPLPPPAATQLLTRIEWDSFGAAWEGQAHELRVTLHTHQHAGP